MQPSYTEAAGQAEGGKEIAVVTLMPLQAQGTANDSMIFCDFTKINVASFVCLTDPAVSAEVSIP